jgi:hypothetical protein
MYHARRNTNWVELSICSPVKPKMDVALPYGS